MESKARILGSPCGEAGRPALPWFEADVPAGFPSPADDYVERRLDLHEHLVEHPAATYFVRAAGDSMTGASIHNGDLLVVDRAVEPRDGSIVIAVLGGELAVKRLRRRDGRVWLASESDAYPPLEVPPEADLAIWGVCRYVIHAL